MTPSDPVPEFGLSWRMREHEARLLADSLRSSRLTLLYAAAGALRSELLRRGVVALVARRETDLSAGADLESRVVEPFVDRRQSAGVVFDPIERAIFFDAWGNEPLVDLLTAIRAAFPSASSLANLGLADLLQILSGQIGARLLVVIDAGERLWAAGTNPVATARFIDAFGDAVNRRQLPVNFLLAVDDRFEGRMESLRRAVPGFDDATVRLLGFEETAASALPTPASRAISGAAPVTPLSAPEPPTLSDAVLAPVAFTGAPPKKRSRRQRPPKIPLPPRVPIKTDGVYAFIESTLTQTADASEPWHDTGDLPLAGDVHSRSDRGAARRGSAAAAGRSQAAMGGAAGAEVERPPVTARAEPPSPIDEWLDSALAWCRRMLRPR